jgi:Rrf2 family cysteine metabolism transcriptional repressor
MRISQRCEYALRALFELARRAEEGPVRIEEIARAQKIPKNFLANLLVQLKRGRFVQSRKGPEGGYFLSRPPRQITVGEVVRFLDGPIGPIQCVARPGAERCPTFPGCGLFPLWKRLHEALAGLVDRTSIADLVEEERRANAEREKILMYHI